MTQMCFDDLVDAAARWAGQGRDLVAASEQLSTAGPEGFTPDVRGPATTAQGAWTKICVALADAADQRSSGLVATAYETHGIDLDVSARLSGQG